MLTMNICKPYVLLIGDVAEQRSAKTAFGLRDWDRENCLGQVRFGASAVDLGLPNMTIQEAVAAGAKTLVIGIATRGGKLPDAWTGVLIDAVTAGLDIASGLHSRLEDVPHLAETAARAGRQLHSIRRFEGALQVGDGRKRTGLRLLTVGTDSALGKKYTALTLTKAMKARGKKADFRATGQTGILIAGAGTPMDSLIGDFLSGGAEALTPDNEPDHWDIIEGQGSLLHPGYAPVSLGLLHGSQPDALVACHDPTRTSLYNYPSIRCPSIEELFEATLTAVKVTNKAARFVGVSLNTASFGVNQAERIIEATARETGLPCVDPVRTGVEPIIEFMEEIYAF